MNIHIHGTALASEKKPELFLFAAVYKRSSKKISHGFHIDFTWTSTHFFMFILSKGRSLGIRR